MFNALRRAWRAYVASIPPPDDPEPVSDAVIWREHFRPPPIEPALRSAFDRLVALVHAHLPEDRAQARSKQASARFKPGAEPEEALQRGLLAGAGLTAAKLGFVGLDWKAREEIRWQAELLCKAHGLPEVWAYDWQTSELHHDCAARGEFPVTAPLLDFGHWLNAHALALCVLPIDDSVLVFAVKLGAAEEARALCWQLGLAEARVVSIPD